MKFWYVLISYILAAGAKGKLAVGYSWFVAFMVYLAAQSAPSSSGRVTSAAMQSPVICRSAYWVDTMDYAN